MSYPTTVEPKLPVRFMFLRQNVYSVRTSTTVDKVTVPCDPYIHTQKVPTAAIGIQVDEQAGKIYYAVASLSNKVGRSGRPDVFSREFARATIEDRLTNPDPKRLAKTRFEVNLDGAFHRYTITGMVLQDIVDRNVDSRAKDERPAFRANLVKRAQEWLAANPDYANVPESKQVAVFDLLDAAHGLIPVDDSPVATAAYHAEE